MRMKCSTELSLGPFACNEVSDENEMLIVPGGHLSPGENQDKNESARPNGPWGLFVPGENSDKNESEPRLPTSFKLISDCPITGKLPNTCTISLTCTSYSTLLIILDTILELTPVACFFPMVATLPATTWNTLIASTGMRNIETQALFAGLNIGEDFTCGRWQEVRRWKGIHRPFIDVDEVPGAAGFAWKGIAR
jgi:hypothetical protein